MKNILITGGSGFIGYNLCKMLKKKGVGKITVIDDYSSGLDSNVLQGISYIRSTTSNINKIKTDIHDTVIHLGEYARVEKSFDDYARVLESNIVGTKAVVEYCLKNNSKLIYAGSSTKFGDGGLARQSSPYAWTKAINTELVNNFSDWFGLRYAITYFYNVYGPSELETGPYATLIGLYKNCMRQNLPLKVVSPGLQVRNFTHVEDICKGILLVAEFGNGDGYGLGHSENYSVIDVAKMFGGEIKMLPPRRGNRMSAELVTAKSISLGWKPTHKLRDYVTKLRENSWQDK